MGRSPPPVTQGFESAFDRGKTAPQKSREMIPMEGIDTALEDVTIFVTLRRGNEQEDTGMYGLNGTI